MQAIHTKYISATNTRGSRIKARCERGSITIDYPHELGPGGPAHAEAARQLVAKFIKEDVEKYGSRPDANPWAGPFVTGGLPDHSYAHVFLGRDPLRRLVTLKDDKEAGLFDKYVQKCRETDGTVTGVWAGIGSSTIKHAVIS